MTPYVQPRMDSLLAALEQMDAAEAAHVPAPVADEPPVVPAHEARDHERVDPRHDEMFEHLEQQRLLGEHRHAG